MLLSFFFFLIFLRFVVNRVINGAKKITLESIFIPDDCFIQCFRRKFVSMVLYLHQLFYHCQNYIHWVQCFCVF